MFALHRDGTGLEERANGSMSGLNAASRATQKRRGSFLFAHFAEACGSYPSLGERVGPGATATLAAILDPDRAASVVDER
jgi:hypothetical protein